LRAARLELQPLADIDPVAVGVGEHEAAQAVVSVPQALHDADPVPGQVVVQLCRVCHQEVGNVAGAGPMVPGEGEVQFGCVPFEDGDRSLYGAYTCIKTTH
jgi:hypothetical protein